jgi:hypothetical protein
MADQSDVEAALVAVVTAALYPGGTAAPSAVGATCRIFRGWPNAAALDADLAAGRVNLTVFPVEGAVRNTTRYANEWQAVAPAPTLTVSISGSSATFAGRAYPGQLAGVLADGKAYVHRTQAGDTPELVAATLADTVRTDRIALLSGATLTVPGAVLVARTGADASAVLEVRRQEQSFRLTAWCPSPALRDAACGRIDAVLSAARFLSLADGTTGRHRFAGAATFDQSQDASLYRRDLIYAVDYPTTITATQPVMLFGDLGFAGTDTLS